MLRRVEYSIFTSLCLFVSFYIGMFFCSRYLDFILKLSIPEDETFVSYEFKKNLEQKFTEIEDLQEMGAAQNSQAIKKAIDKKREQASSLLRFAEVWRRIALGLEIVILP